MNRIVVVGTTGAGKSTFAGKLAEIINGKHYELDRLFWMPDWEQRSKEEYAATLSELVKAEYWVADGNSSSHRKMLWGCADTVIWLDYPFFLNFFRLLGRTIQRAWTKEEVFDGCSESIKTQFFSRNSLMLWFFKSYGRRKRTYQTIFEENQYPHLKILVFEHPREAKFFLESLQNDDF